MRLSILLLIFWCLPSVSAAFDLQGHRGARGLAPENTLPAFARALSIGVTTLELDTAITKDGVVVISHDPLLNKNIVRGPDGQWLAGHGPAIRSLDWAELARYDVGRINPDSRYARGFPDQQPIDGTRIPRLADLFALVRKSGNTSVQFDIETKISPRAPQNTLAPEPFARALIKVIRDAGMEARTMIQSFDWRTLAIVQKEAPAIRTVYLSAQQNWLDNIEAGGTEASPWTAGIRHGDHGSVPKMIKAAGGRIWAPYHRDIDEAKIKEAHALGLAVVPWTVNDSSGIARIIEMGADGIISDRPDRVRDEMKRRNMPLPAATPVTP